MLIKRITYFGRPAAVGCDGKCYKAWGINKRPKKQLSDNPDDYEYPGDYLLGDAPEDPGTSEGGKAKPTRPEDRLNTWCVKERERCGMTNPEGHLVELPDFETSVRNIKKDDSDKSAPKDGTVSP